MSQILNQINFCSTKTLCESGFSRREASSIMNAIIKDYKKEGYLLLYSHNKVPMSYAEVWAEKKLKINLTKKEQA